jgi:tetratricopeptide (TPR) repeat protein
MGEGEATLIFSNNATSWGSFFYNEKEDALRVTVKTFATTETVERLKYEFMDETDNSATAALLWEKLKIPFKISVDLTRTQLASFRNELRTDKGFKWEAWVEAINFCVANNTNLEEALEWSDYAITAVFVGQKNFRTLSAKAAVLSKLNRQPEADVLMKEAMPLATMLELHNYGRQLLRDKKAALALEAFKLNAQKNPNAFTTTMGLMRGYSATGDYKSALKYAKLAQPIAPDKASKDALEGFVKLLQEGKDIN